MNRTFADQKKEFERMLSNAIQANKNIFKEMSSNLVKIKEIKEINENNKSRSKRELGQIEKSFRNLTNVIDKKNTSLDRQFEKMQKFEISKNDYINKQRNFQNSSFGTDFKILENLKNPNSNLLNAMRKSKSTNNIPYKRHNFVTPPVNKMSNTDHGQLGFDRHNNVDSNLFNTNIPNDELSNLNLNQSQNYSSDEDVVVKFSLTKFLQKRAREENPLKNQKIFLKKLNSVFQ